MQDADEILKMDPGNVRGLVWKAESQYNLANFEHSLKYFHRYGRMMAGFDHLTTGLS